MLKLPILQFPHILLHLIQSFCTFSNTPPPPPPPHTHTYTPQPLSTWDELKSSRDEHTANNLWCLSKEVRSGLHTLGTLFLPLSLLHCCQKNILICILWLEEWQTDRQTHVHGAHLFSCSWPTIDCRAAERVREKLLYNRWFSLRSWDETLCVTSALWSFLRLQSVQAPLLGFVPVCWGQMSA